MGVIVHGTIIHGFTITSDHDELFGLFICFLLFSR